MEKRLKTQLENSQEIRNVLRKVDIRFKLKEQPVETLLIYLPCKEGVCDHSGLFRIIKQYIMTNFVLSCAEIENKLSINRKKAPEELFKKAVRKISKHTAKGELGELLLFTILEVYFNAPKILSKISHKTSRRMPVLGADAVHAQFVDGALRLYLGESKLHKKFSSASSKAVKSISSFIEKYREEFDLIDSHIDFPDINTAARLELIDHLNPFSDGNEFDSEILHAPCFIGFVEPSVFCDDEKCYKNQCIEVAKKHIRSFYSKLEKNNDINKTALMLLPFSSLDELVNGFVSHMGIEK